MTAKFIIAISVLFFFIISFFGCQTNTQPRNAELVVEYFGKKVHHKKPRWTSYPQLMNTIKKSEKKFLIFAADWCPSCTQLRSALDEAMLLDNVEFLNLEEPWVAHLAKSYNIKNIPFMIEIDENNTIQEAKIGSGQIVIHLLVKLEK